MKFINILLLILISIDSTIVSAEVGYVFEADLNGDGVTDSLKSGPQDLFGNGSGPFMLRVSNEKGGFSQIVIGLHPKAVALEKNGPISKVWSYHRSSSSTGKLEYVLLDGNFTKEGIILRFNETRTGLSSEIYKLIFNENKTIGFEVVDNYLPPKYNWGK